MTSPSLPPTLHSSISLLSESTFHPVLHFAQHRDTDLHNTCWSRPVNRVLRSVVMVSIERRRKAERIRPGTQRKKRKRSVLTLFQLQGIIALDAREECVRCVCRGYQRGSIPTKNTFSIVLTTMYQQVADHRSGVPTVNGLAMRQRARPRSVS